MSRSLPLLRVAYLIQQFPPEVGAGPARVTEMASRWQARGVHVTVVTGMPSRAIPGRSFGAGDPSYHGRLFMEEGWGGIRVLRSWLYPASRPGFVHTLLNNVSFMFTSAIHALVRLGPANIMIASSPPLFPHLSGVVVSTLRRIPLILEIRDLWPDYLVSMGMLRAGALHTRALFAFERWLLARADHVVVVTESFRQRVIEKGVDPSRVSVIPNGVDLEQYRPFEGDFSPPLATLERKDGEFLIGYLGTFGAGQDLSTIVDAATILAREDPTIRIILVGDGLDRARVMERITHLSLPNLSIHPSIQKTETRSFYAACDACLVPLAPVRVFQETVPSKIFEIMACERAVVASVEGEAERIVEASCGGIVAAPGNARSIADAIHKLRGLSIEQRAAMGRAGRAYVAKHYRRDELAERYLTLCGAIAAPASPD